MYKIGRSLIVGFAITAAALLVMDLPVSSPLMFTVKRYAPMLLEPGQYLVNAAVNGRIDTQSMWVAAVVNTFAWAVMVLMISLIFRMIRPAERA
jgi:hypothetical protein